MGRPTFDHQDQGIIKSEVVGDGLELLLAGTCWSSITYWPCWKALRLFMSKVSGRGEKSRIATAHPGRPAPHKQRNVYIGPPTGWTEVLARTLSKYLHSLSMKVLKFRPALPVSCQNPSASKVECQKWPSPPRCQHQGQGRAGGSAHFAPCKKIEEVAVSLRHLADSMGGRWWVGRSHGTFCSLEESEGPLWELRHNAGSRVLSAPLPPCKKECGRSEFFFPNVNGSKARVAQVSGVGPGAFCSMEES